LDNTIRGVKLKKLPLGIQNFRRIIEDGYVCDKTVPSPTVPLKEGSAG